MLFLIISNCGRLQTVDTTFNKTNIGKDQASKHSIGTIFFSKLFHLHMDFLVDYVEELFQFFLQLSKEQLQGAVQDLKEMTPEPMNSMLVDKQPRGEAIRKRAERLSMVTRDVPPTSDPEEGHSAGQSREQSTRARPLCSACKNPMRGHRFIEDCPKNRKE